MSAGLATLLELSTVYGTEDAYDLLEIIAVNRHNQEIARQHQERDR